MKRKMIFICASLLLLAIPVGFNACGTSGQPGSSNLPSTTDQLGGTTGNPLVPLRALAFGAQRTYLSCFKGLQLRKSDGTILLVPIVEVPTVINFSGTEFGSFEFPNGTYDQIRLIFSYHCTLGEVPNSSFVVENSNGSFFSHESFVMKFDGQFTYPDPYGRSPVLDLAPIVLEFESVTSDEEIKPAATRSNGTFNLE